MFNFLHLSYQHLYWRRPTSPAEPPPPGTERIFISTEGGDLELLVAKPAHQSPGVPPVFFVHGGMGSAWVWHEYMRYLAEQGITSYAVSMRGHGASWHPSFFRMLYATPKRALVDDVVACMRAVQEWEDSELVLVGHSSGGGLSQFIVGEGLVKVKGLALLGAIPGTGSFSVYLNWWKFDPWFTIRLLFHGWHSNSPLSHPYLVKQAFFSKTYPDDKLTEFTRHLSRYESYLWPMGMISRFVDPLSVLANITGWERGSKMLIMAGTEEALVTKPIQQATVDTYRRAFHTLVTTLVGEKELEAKDETIRSMDDGLEDDEGHGVQKVRVPGAGHHLQNDVTWVLGAEKLVSFLRQL